MKVRPSSGNKSNYLPHHFQSTHKIHSIFQQIKEDLETHNRPVSSCVDQVRQVVLTGSDVLSSDEVATLEKSGRALKTRFDRAADRTDRLLRRLTGANDELSKFKCVEEELRVNLICLMINTIYSIF